MIDYWILSLTFPIGLLIKGVPASSRQWVKWHDLKIKLRSIVIQYINCTSVLIRPLPGSTGSYLASYGAWKIQIHIYSNRICNTNFTYFYLVCKLNEQSRTEQNWIKIRIREDVNNISMLSIWIFPLGKPHRGAYHYFVWFVVSLSQLFWQNQLL